VQLIGDGKPVVHSIARDGGHRQERAKLIELVRPECPIRGIIEDV
jgi:hypothetical protein